MAEVINVNEFKNGITFMHNGEVYIVLDSTHSKQGRGQANVKVKARNMFNGSTVNLSFTGGEKVEKAFVSRNKMQYLYPSGDSIAFMDTTTFEQVEIPVSNLKWEMNFLVEGQEVNVTTFEGRVLGVQLDKNLTIEVGETTDAVRGDTVTNATKKATLVTGFELDVPQFITKGEKIVVSTVDGKYVSRG